MAALTKMRQEDPTWVVEQSKELRQTIIHGQGEFHLRTLKWRLENNEKIPVKFVDAKIPYRETITKAHVPTTVTRNSLVEQASLVKFTLLLSLMQKACPIRLFTGSTARSSR